MHPKIIETPMENLIPREAGKTRKIIDFQNAETRESFVRVIKFRGSRGSVPELILYQKTMNIGAKIDKKSMKIDARKSYAKMMTNGAKMEATWEPKSMKHL